MSGWQSSAGICSLGPTSWEQGSRVREENQFLPDSGRKRIMPWQIGWRQAAEEPGHDFLSSGRPSRSQGMISFLPRWPPRSQGMIFFFRQRLGLEHFLRESSI